MFFFRQKFWADIPAPLLTKVYLFNVSNPKEVSSTGAKPILKEVGPFVFDEYHKKVKIQWNENNDTVTYQQIRTYFLDKVTIMMVLFICICKKIEGDNIFRSWCAHFLSKILHILQMC